MIARSARNVDTVAAVVRYHVVGDAVAIALNDVDDGVLVGGNVAEGGVRCPNADTYAAFGDIRI